MIYSFRTTHHDRTSDAAMPWLALVHEFLPEPFMARWCSCFETLRSQERSSSLVWPILLSQIEDEELARMIKFSGEESGSEVLALACLLEATDRGASLTSVMRDGVVTTKEVMILTKKAQVLCCLESERRRRKFTTYLTFNESLGEITVSYRQEYAHLAQKAEAFLEMVFSYYQGE